MSRLPQIDLITTLEKRIANDGSALSEFKLREGNSNAIETRSFRTATVFTAEIF